MGIGYQATCACGYEGHVSVGCGMHVPAGRKRPVELGMALCRPCRSLQSVNVRARKPRCEDCGAIVTLYAGTASLEQLVAARPADVRPNARPASWAGPEDYVYRCPQCDRVTLRLVAYVCWD